MTLLLLYVCGALAISFVCSLLEASLLSTRVVELIHRSEDGDRHAKMLLTLKQERLDDAISAILILNTIANTAGAVLAGAQAGKVFADGRLWIFTLVGLFSAAMILGVLLVSEIIPKNLGATYAGRLVPFTAKALVGLIWLLRPLLYLTRFLTRLLARREKNKIFSRAELATIVALATREGTLAAADSRVVSNVLRSHEIHVEDVMTPRTVLAMLPDSSTIRALLADERCRAFSRIPLFEDTPDHVIGYVLQREVLAAAAQGRDFETPLSHFLRKAFYLPKAQPVGRAMERLISLREHLAFVTDEYGGLAGVVTLEDLLETLLGVEILDESDRVVDLRTEAARLREKRLAQRGQLLPRVDNSQD